LLTGGAGATDTTRICSMAPSRRRVKVFVCGVPRFTVVLGLTSACAALAYLTGAISTVLGALLLAVGGAFAPSLLVRVTVERLSRLVSVPPVYTPLRSAPATHFPGTLSAFCAV